MSKQRLCRGKPIGGGEMVYGWYVEILVKLKITSFIVLDGSQYVNASPAGTKISGLVEVIPESVGQSTGLKDKNGQDLDWWEGDVFTRPDYLPGTFDRIIFEDGCFFMWSDKYKHRDLLYEAVVWEIYTKSTDKTELLENKQ